METKRLALAGKIHIFRSLALLNALYCCSSKVDRWIKSCPEGTSVRWGSPKSKHTVIINNYNEGDYNDVDIDSKIHAIKMSWIKWLLDPNAHSWKLFSVRCVRPSWRHNIAILTIFGPVFLPWLSELLSELFETWWVFLKLCMKAGAQALHGLAPKCKLINMHELINKSTNDYVTLLPCENGANVNNKG